VQGARHPTAVGAEQPTHHCRQRLAATAWAMWASGALRQPEPASAGIRRVPYAQHPKCHGVNISLLTFRPIAHRIPGGRGTLSPRLGSSNIIRRSRGLGHAFKKARGPRAAHHPCALPPLEKVGVGVWAATAQMHKAQARQLNHSSAHA
jgi:hypothetical protein